MLQKALQTTSRQITEHLSREVRNLGHRTTELETNTEDFLTRTTHLELELDMARAENKAFGNRIEDAENRSRRSNLRIREIPEQVQDLQATMTALFQDLVPDLPVEELELDWVHSALTCKCTSGQPRDIVSRLHFYRTKELIHKQLEPRNPSLTRGGIIRFTWTWPHQRNTAICDCNYYSCKHIR